MKTIIASLAVAIIAAAAISGAAKTEALAAGLSGNNVFADRAEVGGGYIAVDYNTYFYTHKPGSTPPNNGNNSNGDQTRSNRPNEQPPTTCTNVRVDNRSGPPTWKQVCRTGYF